MEIMNYIAPESIILIPVLYILGMIIKGIENIPDKYIPLILLLFGICLSLASIGFNVDSAVQGALITGVTVYGNQVVKQMSKDK